MKYFKLEAEVAGGWGSRTLADVSVHPPTVQHLDFEFAGWSGDDILATFPCYIVTGTLADRLRASDLSGWRLLDVEISRSAEFDELYPDLELPQFERLSPIGVAGVDDIGATPIADLILSERALAMFKEHRLTQSAVSEWSRSP